MNLFTFYQVGLSDPDRTFLTTETGLSFTYGDAQRYSAQVANFLLGLGLAQGERVTVQVEK